MEKCFVQWFLKYFWYLKHEKALLRVLIQELIYIGQYPESATGSVLKNFAKFTGNTYVRVSF